MIAKVSTQDENNDEINIVEVFVALKKRRKSIIYGVLISMALLTGILLVLPKSYESTAVLSLGDISKGINIPTFRSMENVYANTDLFGNYLKGVEGKTGWHVYDELFTNTIKPIYGYDMKSTVSIDHNTVLGLKITCGGSTPEEAKDRVVLLGNYVETVILNNWIWEFVNLEKGNARTDLSRNNSSILQTKFEIENLKEKGELLENNFPSSMSMRSAFEAQIVQVDEVTEKYLSPKQQLVSVKVSIKNNEIEVNGLERKLRMNQTMLNFLEIIESRFDQEKQFLYDVGLLDKVSAEKDAFFSDQDSNKSHKEVYFAIEEELNEFFNLRHAHYKFISGPTINSEPVKPQVLLSLVIGLLSFVMFFVSRALILNWWKF